MDNTEQKYRSIPVRFRFLVKQTGDNSVSVEVPVGLGANMIDININSRFCETAKISPAEHDAAVEAAENAIIRSLMIVRE